MHAHAFAIALAALAASTAVRPVGAAIVVSSLSDSVGGSDEIDTRFPGMPVFVMSKLAVVERNACKLAFQPTTTTAVQTTTQPPKPSPSPPTPPPPPPPAPRPPAPRPATQQPPAPLTNNGGGNFGRSSRRPALAYSTSEEASAQAWANSATWAHNRNGQNMYSGTSSDCTDAVDAWYDEISLIRNGDRIVDIWAKAGHVTQMLDRRSTSAGCAVGRKTVCNFDPPGNVMGDVFRM
ncbi:CAP domain-containing protein [Entophlyctis helioformis]|nr:CAP domain-containing protein [Entophlyctis helioformis]